MAKREYTCPLCGETFSSVSWISLRGVIKDHDTSIHELLPIIDRRGNK